MVLRLDSLRKPSSSSVGLYLARFLRQHLVEKEFKATREIDPVFPCHGGKSYVGCRSCVSFFIYLVFILLRKCSFFVLFVYLHIFSLYFSDSFVSMSFYFLFLLILKKQKLKQN